MKRNILLALLMFSTVGMTGCIKYNGRPVEKEDTSSAIKVTLTTDSLELKIGDGGKTFSATLESEEVLIDDKTLVISSSDTSVATTDLSEVEEGKDVRVKGLKEGTSYITVASKQDKTAYAILSVKVNAGDGTFAVESIEAVTSELKLEVGETKTLEDPTDFKVLPENATNKGVKFESSDTEVISISTTGTLTAKAESKRDAEDKYIPVTIKITTLDGAKEATISVTVEVDQTPIVDKYYLLGDNAKYGWDKENCVRRHELSVNPGNANELMIKFEADTDQKFKVVQYKGPSAELVWFNADVTLGPEQRGACNYDEDKNFYITGKKATYTLYLDLSSEHDGMYKYYVQAGN